MKKKYILMRGTRDVRKEERPISENLLTIPQTDKSRTHDQHQMFKQMKYGYEQIKKKKKKPIVYESQDISSINSN